jgi:hypothetical protein
MMMGLMTSISQGIILLRDSRQLMILDVRKLLYSPDGSKIEVIALAHVCIGPVTLSSYKHQRPLNIEESLQSQQNPWFPSWRLNYCSQIR